MPDTKEIHRLRFGLMTEEDLADMIDVTPRTLAAWRIEGKSPASVRIGKNIFYRHEDIQTWIAINVTVLGTEREPDD